MPWIPVRKEYLHHGRMRTAHASQPAQLCWNERRLGVTKPIPHRLFGQVVLEEDPQRQCFRLKAVGTMPDGHTEATALFELPNTGLWITDSEKLQSENAKSRTLGLSFTEPTNFNNLHLTFRCDTSIEARTSKDFVSFVTLYAKPIHVAGLVASPVRVLPPTPVPPTPPREAVAGSAAPLAVMSPAPQWPLPTDPLPPSPHSTNRSEPVPLVTTDDDIDSLALVAVVSEDAVASEDVAVNMEEQLGVSSFDKLLKAEVVVMEPPQTITGLVWLLVKMLAASAIDGGYSAASVMWVWFLAVARSWSPRAFQTQVVAAGVSGDNADTENAGLQPDTTA